jgi:hypothetical protein
MSEPREGEKSQKNTQMEAEMKSEQRTKCRHAGSAPSVSTETRNDNKKRFPERESPDRTELPGSPNTFPTFFNFFQPQTLDSSVLF